MSKLRSRGSRPQFPMGKWAKKYSKPGNRSMTITVKHTGLTQTTGRQVNGQTGLIQSTTTGVTPAGSSTMVNGSGMISLNLEQQQLVRATYKQCLEQQALSGKFMTSAQRQSLLTAISMEAAAQPPPGQQVSLPQQEQAQVPSGLPSSPNQSTTTAELAKLLRAKLSILESGSLPPLPSSVIKRSE